MISIIMKDSCHDQDHLLRSVENSRVVPSGIIHMGCTRCASTRILDSAIGIIDDIRSSQNDKSKGEESWCQKWTVHG